ncbi:hypothetical protein BDL97_17G031500 [Sphagnum fallax]|nr:hypothetical protein BDL97_17G031500 [Sphagnum fallax]
MRLLALCCGGDWPTGICGSRARQQRVCARDRPTDLRRPRGYGRRKKRDPNLHRTWSNRAGSCKAEEMLTPRVHFWVRGVGDGSQIEKVVMSFDISNQIPLKEGIEGEGGPKTGAERVTFMDNSNGRCFCRCRTVIPNNQLFNATLKLLTSEESHS